MSSQFSADDLLVLLAVSRTGRFTSAARELELNHTTIARRIAALEDRLGGRALARGGPGWVLTPLGERAVAAAEQVEQALAPFTEHVDRGLSGLIRLSATDGFSGFIASPAMAALRLRHPGVTLEIITGTRQASPQRVGADLEVVVGRPQVRRAEAVQLGEYVLGLYVSRDYLHRHGTPASRAELSGAPLIYFIESMLQVDALDDARRAVPAMVDAVASTNVYVHVEATRGG
ncbi:MAG: LysR family transcriptional regulator, partial [Pseudolysinimonas sp.]